MKSLLYLNDILTNTESVSLFSQANLENSGMGVGLLPILSSRYSRTCLLR